MALNVGQAEQWMAKKNKRKIRKVLKSRVKSLEKRTEEAYDLLEQVEKRLLSSGDPIEIARFGMEAETLRNTASGLIKEWERTIEKLEEL